MSQLKNEPIRFSTVGQLADYLATLPKDAPLVVIHQDASMEHEIAVSRLGIQTDCQLLGWNVAKRLEQETGCKPTFEAINDLVDSFSTACYPLEAVCLEI